MLSSICNGQTPFEAPATWGRPACAGAMQQPASPLEGLRQLIGLVAMLEAAEQLQGLWGSLQGAEGGPGCCQQQQQERGDARQVEDLAKGQSTQTPGGARVSWGADGTVTIDLPRGRRPERGGHCGRDGGPGVEGPAGKGGGQDRITVRDGQITLPDGRTMAMAKTGAILRLPDGSQVALGRQNENGGLKTNRVSVGGREAQMVDGEANRQATQVIDLTGLGAGPLGRPA